MRRLFSGLLVIILLCGCAVLKLPGKIVETIGTVVETAGKAVVATGQAVGKIAGAGGQAAVAGGKVAETAIKTPCVRGAITNKVIPCP